MRMRSVTKRSLRALGAALLALSSALPAAAGLVANARSSILLMDGSGYYDSISKNTDDGSLTPGEIVHSQGILGGTDPQSAIASTRVNYGSIGVLADVSVSNQTPYVHPIFSPRSTQVLAQAWSSWVDSFSFVKAGASSGTLVDVRVNMVVDIEDVSALIDSQSLTVAQVRISAFDRHWCLQVSTPGYSCHASALALQVGRNEISFDVQAMTGYSYDWGAQMDASSSVESLSYFSQFNSLASVHAMNTAHSYFTVLTPDTIMLSASGHDYALPSSAVPEPASYASVLIGLGFIGVLLRRRERGGA